MHTNINKYLFNPPSASGIGIKTVTKLKQYVKQDANVIVL